MLRISIFRRPIPLVTTAVVAIAIPIVTSGTFRSDATQKAQPANDEIITLRFVPSLSSELEVELITLRPSGFEPSEITRPKGSFALFVDDRSGKENSSLVLHRVNGERLRAINLNRKKSEWHDVVDLSPGTYMLQDASNSELRCQITILP